MEMALADSELDRIGRQTMQTTIAVEDIKVSPKPALKLRPGPGLCKGSILYMAPDFDAPLEEMKEYME